MKNQKKKLLLFIFVFLFLGINLYSQDLEFRKTSIKTGFGIGMNEGKNETGTGLFYSIGWQKSLGNKNKLRINPNLLMGEFVPFIITDLPDEYYRITVLGLNLNYDLIKFHALSLVTTVGVWGDFTRGLIGTGGYHSTSTSSEYVGNLYCGGNFSLALRIDPKKSKLAYEIRPFNFMIGTKDFFSAYLMFGIDFKLTK